MSRNEEIIIKIKPKDVAVYYDREFAALLPNLLENDRLVFHIQGYKLTLEKAED